MQSDRDARIKERAYQIWVDEGRVEGKHDEHWHRAEREIAAEEARAGADQQAEPVRHRGAMARAGNAAPAKKAAPAGKAAAAKAVAPASRSRAKTF